MNFKRKFVSVAQKVAVPANVKYQAYKTERDEFRKIADEEKMRAMELGKTRKKEDYREAKRRYYEERYGVSKPEPSGASSSRKKSSGSAKTKAKSSKSKSATRKTSTSTVKTKKPAAKTSRKTNKRKQPSQAKKRTKERSSTSNASQGMDFFSTGIEISDPFRW